MRCFLLNLALILPALAGTTALASAPESDSRTNNDKVTPVEGLGAKATTNPNSAEAYFHRGNAKLRNGDLDGALADYGEAIRLKPDMHKVFANRGYVKQAKGDLERGAGRLRQGYSA